MGLGCIMVYLIPCINHKSDRSHQTGWWFSTSFEENEESPGFSMENGEIASPWGAGDRFTRTWRGLWGSFIYIFMIIHVRIYINTYIRACMHTYVCKYIYTYIYTYMYLYIYIYIYIYICIYMYIYMCIYIYTYIC